MKANVTWAKLHSPLHYNATNFGDTLDPEKRNGLKLTMDYENDRLMVGWNGKIGFLPRSSIMVWEEGEPSKRQKVVEEIKQAVAGAKVVHPGMEPQTRMAQMAAPAPQPAQPVIAKSITAQVESPMGHVHAGPGKGKTGLEDAGIGHKK